MSRTGVSSVVEGVQRRLQRLLLLAAVLWACVAAALVLLVAWVSAGPEGWRQGTWMPLVLDLLLLAVLGTGLVLLHRLRRRWLAEAHVARCVEEAAGLGPGTVLGSLELSRRVPPGVSPGLARFAEEALLRRLDHPPERLAEPLRRPITAWTRGALAGLALSAPVLLLALVASPGRSLSAWGGLSTPVVLLLPPVLPPLLVAPGNQEVQRGSSVEVTVTAGARESVTLHWQAAGDVARSSTLALDEHEQARHVLGAVAAPVRYWVVAADGARSETFQLTPVDPLFVSDLRVVVDFPLHTGRLPEEYAGDVPPLTLPRGSRLRLEGRASRVLGSGTLELRGGAERVALEVGGAGFSAQWTPGTSGVWDWAFEDEHGEPAELLPGPLELTLTADVPPQVRFVFPAQDTVLPLNLRQPLVLEVEDDYGVASVDVVAWRVTATGERGEPVPLELEVGGARSALLRPVLDVSGWGLLPGDRVHYLGRVTDNAPAGQTAASREWVLRMPGAAEMRRDAQETLEEAARRVEALARQAERAAEETRTLERQAAAERSATQQRGRAAGDAQGGAGFQQREDVRQALERQMGMAGEVEALGEELRALSEAMREAGVADPGLRSDLEELQRLLDEVSPQELRERLGDMMQNLDGMDARQAQEALRQLGESQQQFRQMLEESLERFRRAAVEQDFRATTSEAEELARLERALADALADPADAGLRASQQAELGRRAEQVESSMQALQERLQQLGEAQAAAGVESGREQAAQARQAMAQAERQAREGRPDAARQQAERAAASMEQAASDLREARRDMADEKSEALRQALEGAAEDALGLARRQAELQGQMNGATPEEMASLRGDMNALLQGLRSMTENVAGAMQQSGAGDREVTEQAARAEEAMERTLAAMGQARAGSTAPQAAEGAVDALNQLALSALAGARRAGEQGEGQGQPQQGDVMQQLEGLAQQQGQLNSQSGQMMPMQLGEQALQNQLQDIARGQESVAGELGRLANEPGAEQALGDLEALAREARELAERLAGGRLDAETRQRQERLFHRLLDAGRTLQKEEEVSEERESRTGGPVETRQVGPLTPEALGAIRFRLPDREILDRLGPAERQLVIEYFERLNREAPRPAATPPAAAGGGP